MRALPFAKRLMGRLRAGDRPWVVVMSVGGAGLPSPQRKAWFKDGKSAYIRVPDGVRVERADWSIFVALDILIVIEDACTTERAHAVFSCLWRAKVATLWLLRTEGFRDKRPRVRRLDYDSYPSKSGPWYVKTDVLPEAFKEELTRVRQSALLWREPPLYDAPVFDAARAERCAQLGIDPGVYA